MNNYQKLAVLLFILGIILIAISFLKNEGNVGIFLIFPVFWGTGFFAFLGVLLIFIAFFLFFFGFVNLKYEDFEREEKKTETKTNYGGVVLVGPIPIIFGKDVRLTIILVILAIVLILVIWFLFYWK